MSLLGSKSIQNILGLMVVLVLFLSSCKDSQNPTFGFDPGFDPTDMHYVELHVPVQVFRYDSVRTSVNQSGRALVGTIKDPEFGTQKGSVYTMMRKSSKIIPTDAVYDSATLSLTGIYGYGDVFTSPLAISLHELKNTPDSTDRENRNFYTFDQVDYNSSSLLNRSIQVENEDATSNTVDSLFNLRMPDGYGIRLYNSAQVEQEDLDELSQKDFSTEFPGFAITDDRNTTNGMLGFNLDNSGIRVFYHTPTDTSNAVFSFSFFNSADTSFFANFTGIAQDYSGTPLAAMKDTLAFVDVNKDLGGDAYLKAGAGIFAALRTDSILADYQKAVESDSIQGGIMVNSAELLIPYDDTDVTDFKKEPNPILVYRADEDFRTLNSNLLPNDAVDPTLENPGENIVRLSPNTNKKYYKATITRYVQALLNGDMEEKNKLMLAPGPFHDQLEGLKIEGDQVVIRMYFTTGKKP